MNVREATRAHPRRVDAALALVVLVLAVLVPDPDRPAGSSLPPAAVGLAVVTCAALALRRERPRTVLVVTLAGNAAYVVLTGGGTLLQLAAVIALYTVAERRDRRVTRFAWLGAVLVLACAEAVARSGLDPDQISTLAWLTAGAATGDALGHRRAYLAALEERAERAERDREQAARRQVAEERLRIARELHDVVAHNMAVVTVQAGVASHLLPGSPAAAQEALGHVRRAAAGILDELGDILNVLRQEDDGLPDRAPAPGLDRVEQLLSSFAASGLEVRWSMSGRPRTLSPAVDLVAYRLLQEALTNAQKHGTGTAELRIGHLAGELHLHVGNPAPAGVVPAAGGGHGLVGMRERAAAVGGRVRAALGSDGLFHVEAVLPVAAQAGPATAAATSSPGAGPSEPVAPLVPAPSAP